MGKPCHQISNLTQIISLAVSMQYRNIHHHIMLAVTKVYRFYERHCI